MRGDLKMAAILRVRPCVQMGRTEAVLDAVRVPCSLEVVDLRRGCVVVDDGGDRLRGVAGVCYIDEVPDAVTLLPGQITVLPPWLIVRLWRADRAARVVQGAWRSRRFRREKSRMIAVDDLLFDSGFDAVPWDIVDRILRIRMRLRLSDR